LLVDVEVNNKDESYSWLLSWMVRQQREKASSSDVNSGFLDGLVQRIKPRMHHLSVQTTHSGAETGPTRTQFALVPGIGRHFLRYKRAFIAVERLRETKALDLQGGRPWETVKLTTLYAHRHIFEELFKEAHELAMKEREGYMTIYTAWSTEWKPFGKPRQKRPLESVILAAGVKERVLSDVEDFIGSMNWYRDRGIPYRRGYLLYGPPGTGKSSFIQALAGELDFNICLLNLSERGLTDDRLNHLLTNAPARSIILLEDIDAAFANRRVQSDEHGYRGANVTFSGLLNALDGVASSQERIVFLTTNHFERLDPALIRPGRVDLYQELGPLTREQTQRLWRRFYSDQDADRVYEEQFLATLDGAKAWDNNGRSVLSPAAVQGVFLWNKGNMEGAVGMVPQLVQAFAKPIEASATI
jgi:chaperone BCS1